MSKKWRQSADVFELFFLAIYNEEILEGGTGSPSMVKRVEEVRVPSVRFPSVYHDPSKLGFSPEFGSVKYINSIACVQVKIFSLVAYYYIYKHINNYITF